PAGRRRAAGAHPAPGELPRARAEAPAVERGHEPAPHVEDADLNVGGSVEREREGGRGREGIGPSGRKRGPSGSAERQRSLRPRDVEPDPIRTAELGLPERQLTAPTLAGSQREG